MKIHIVYSGKAKDYPGYKYLLWAFYFNPENSRPMEKLKEEDFIEILN